MYPHTIGSICRAGGGVVARPGPRPLGGGGGGGSVDPPRRSPAPVLAAADGRTAVAGAQSHEPARHFGLSRKFPRVPARGGRTA